MKTKTRQRLLTLALALMAALIMSITAFAANLTGELQTVDDTHITGWAWNQGIFGDVADVELHLYQDGSSKAAKVITVTANQYNKKLEEAIGDGYHYFDYQIDWSLLNGSSYKVEAYALLDGQKVLLDGTKEYKAAVQAAVSAKGNAEDSFSGPGAKPKETPAVSSGPRKGKSLGMFTTTGYCNCPICSSGSGKTYSGTVPQANHTISADINVFPIGTKLMINDIVYTVEDIGGDVDGRKLDIYYAFHDEALDHGRKTEEVFEVIS